MRIIKILSLFLIFFAASCESTNFEAERRKLELKEKQLDYLERLYRIRDNIDIKEQIRVLDSLILEEKKNHEINT